tara:strand:+ start:23900 stop:24394 length:495 start_codon:yes stop_codon:yes gene_type:complete
MMSALKDALSAKPKQAFSVFVGFWIFAAAMILLPDELQYMVTVGQPFLVIGGVGYLIPALKGLPDWWDKKCERDRKKKIIASLQAAAKNCLRGILIRNRRTYTAERGQRELIDHNVIEFKAFHQNNDRHIYQITDEYWPLLQGDGIMLLYKGRVLPEKGPSIGG